MNLNRLSLAMLLILPALPGCSGPVPATTEPAAVVAPAASTAMAAAATATATATAATGQPATANTHASAKPTACVLITATEMSEIFGRAMQAEAHEGSVDKTECIYKPADGISPYIELTVEWGEGETAMRAMGAMANVEPGIANPYAGIGDQAVAVGTALMIRSGDDLVTITFSGVDDAPAKARQIFDMAKARM